MRVLDDALSSGSISRVEMRNSIWFLVLECLVQEHNPMTTLARDLCQEGSDRKKRVEGALRYEFGLKRTSLRGASRFNQSQIKDRAGMDRNGPGESQVF